MKKFSAYFMILFSLQRFDKFSFTVNKQQEQEQYYCHLHKVQLQPKQVKCLQVRNQVRFTIYWLANQFLFINLFTKQCLTNSQFNNKKQSRDLANNKTDFFWNQVEPWEVEKSPGLPNRLRTTVKSEIYNLLKQNYSKKQRFLSSFLLTWSKYTDPK